MPNDIYLYGDIGESWWGDTADITDKNILAQLDALPQNEELNVHINSMGGYTHHGVAIFNILQSYSKKQKALNSNFSLTTITDGFAYSAASIIFLAGDKRVMNLGSRNMMHNPWSGGAGDYREMQKISDSLKTGRDAVASMYAAVTGKKEEDIKTLMDDETYFSAKEAVDFGLATEAPETKVESNKADPYEMNRSIFADLSKMPKGSYITAMYAVKRIPQKDRKSTLDRLTRELQYDKMVA